MSNRGQITMAHRLVVDISEDVYESLVETAKKVGQDPKTLAAEWLADATQRVHDDPLERFIGAFNSRAADWADNHDKYIGEGAMKTVRDAGHADG